MQQATIVHQFEYRDTLVRFSLSTYRGRVYMDIRAFWQPAPGEPWQPTKKGLRHSVEALEDWQAGLSAIAAAVEGSERSTSTWADAA